MVDKTSKVQQRRVKEQNENLYRRGAKNEVANLYRRRIEIEQRRKMKRKRRAQRIYRLFFMITILSGIVIGIKMGVTQLSLFMSEESMASEKLNDKRKQMYHDIMEKKSEYPEMLIEAMEGNEELTEFVYHYKDREEYQNKKVSVENEVEKGKIPLFMQWDLRWGYNAYGNNMIGISGCGPTCLSMVAVGLTQNTKYTPDAVAEYSEENRYVVNGNTAWALMYEGAEHFGITGQEIGLDQSQIESYLKNGNPIICSMRPGDFTTTGHFIVLTGIKEGKIIVNDPNSRIRSEKLWDFKQIQGQIKNLWMFSKVD